jgi:hypothetical protein
LKTLRKHNEEKEKERKISEREDAVDAVFEILATARIDAFSF